MDKQLKLWPRRRSPEGLTHSHKCYSPHTAETSCQTHFLFVLEPTWFPRCHTAALWISLQAAVWMQLNELCCTVSFLGEILIFSIRGGDKLVLNLAKEHRTSCDNDQGRVFYGTPVQDRCKFFVPPKTLQMHQKSFTLRQHVSGKIPIPSNVLLLCDGENEPWSKTFYWGIYLIKLGWSSHKSLPIWFGFILQHDICPNTRIIITVVVVGNRTLPGIMSLKSASGFIPSPPPPLASTLGGKKAQKSMHFKLSWGVCVWRVGRSWEGCAILGV